MEKRRVVLITDGDVIAKNALEEIAKKIGGRCISQSAGNPSQHSGEELVTMIKQTPNDPVIIMFDDNGSLYKGEGEKALEYVAKSSEVDVLGVVAVASNTKNVSGVRVDFSIDNNGNVVNCGVDKHGKKYKDTENVYGDTVDILNNLDIPLIVGIGDIGKMDGKDFLHKGAPITYKAVKLILERNGINEKGYET